MRTKHTGPWAPNGAVQKRNHVATVKSIKKLAPRPESIRKASRLSDLKQEALINLLQIPQPVFGSFLRLALEMPHPSFTDFTDVLELAGRQSIEDMVKSVQPLTKNMVITEDHIYQAIEKAITRVAESKQRKAIIAELQAARKANGLT